MHAIVIWLANNKVSACLFCLSEQMVSTELVVYLTVNGNFNAFHVKMFASLGQFFFVCFRSRHSFSELGFDIIGLKFLFYNALLQLPIGNGTIICNFIVIVTGTLVLFEHI
jgi:hypothetical protein